MTHPNFMPFTELNWPKEGILTHRIGEFTEKIHKWNRDCFGNIGKRKDSLR